MNRELAKYVRKKGTALVDKISWTTKEEIVQMEATATSSSSPRKYLFMIANYLWSCLVFKFGVWCWCFPIN